MTPIEKLRRAFELLGEVDAATLEGVGQLDDVATLVSEVIAELTQVTFPEIPPVTTLKRRLVAIIRIPEGAEIGIRYEEVSPLTPSDIMVIGQSLASIAFGGATYLRTDEHFSA